MNSPDKITVFAPATVANVACGYDILGFALHEPGDEITVEKSPRPGLEITEIIGDGGKLPKDPELNTATVAISEFLKKIDSDQGFKVKIHKKMPLGSGLGSSAASGVAAVYAANILMGEPMQKKELLPFAMEGERVACGAAHADNTAPALLGGFVIVRSYDPLDVVSIPTPDNLYASIVHPHVVVRTADSRRVLPQQISLSDAVKQWGNIAALVAGITTSNYELIGRSLQDHIIEPARAELIPHFYDVKNAALAAGALGSSISGSGSSIFALTDSPEKAQQIAKAMGEVYNKAGIQNENYVSKVNTEGPQIIS